ncbi:hypothetical protein ACQPW1_21475 [Nocardia sp. CA-128927]|uniref:hypothetical protein n=1 Tax=Nocardia sp. CA-128927 TaxID=3239975 RepID=UPI003D954439
MITTLLSRRLRRFGLGAAVATAVMVLAAPAASAAEARITMSSDNGTFSVWSTYTVTVTADPPMEGAVSLCFLVDGIAGCTRQPIPAKNGTATYQWRPTQQGKYRIDSTYVYADPHGPGGRAGVSDRVTIWVYCPGHQGQSWDCRREP